MRTTLACLICGVSVMLLTAGCAGPEKKLGRGMNNLYEVVRWGEFHRSVEQTALTDGPDVAKTTGAVRGFNRSVARIGLGLYEIVTFPIPSYDPIWKNHLAPNPVFTDSYKPMVFESPAYDTDTSLGFSGGDKAPMIPGSRFRIFEY